jgi:hypothetical protein
LVDGLKPGQRKVQYILLLGVSLRFSRMNWDSIWMLNFVSQTLIIFK